MGKRITDSYIASKKMRTSIKADPKLRDREPSVPKTPFARVGSGDSSKRVYDVIGLLCQFPSAVRLKLRATLDIAPPDYLSITFVTSGG